VSSTRSIYYVGSMREEPPPKAGGRAGRGLERRVPGPGHPQPGTALKVFPGDSSRPMDMWTSSCPMGALSHLGHLQCWPGATHVSTWRRYLEHSGTVDLCY
jgi:hypothetical protein